MSSLITFSEITHDTLNKDGYFEIPVRYLTLLFDCDRRTIFNVILIPV